MATIGPPPGTYDRITTVRSWTGSTSCRIARAGGISGAREFTAEFTADLATALRGIALT